MRLWLVNGGSQLLRQNGEQAPDLLCLCLSLVRSFLGDVLVSRRLGADIESHERRRLSCAAEQR